MLQDCKKIHTFYKSIFGMFKILSIIKLSFPVFIIYTPLLFSFLPQKGIEKAVILAFNFK